jgi:F420-dependent oxidoreductase-like protein
MTADHKTASEAVSLGLNLAGVSLSGPALADLAIRAEEQGFSSIWSSEAWGSDAFTPLAYVAARTEHIRLGTSIAQMAARTPAATAMTVLTLQQLSGGRVDLGLGVSGPQVVEGWHGVPFRKPLQTTREYVHIVREAITGKSKLAFDGEMFQVPYGGDDATGLGKPLRTTMPPAPDTDIYLAAIGPRNVRLAAEVADGLLPYLWSPTRWELAWKEALADAPAGFKIAPTVFVAIGEDLNECRNQVRPRIALHVGGMGPRDQNFYARLVTRYGYDAEAKHIQDLFLSGARAEAAAAVTDEMVDDLCLVGPADRVTRQLDVWRRAPITTLIVEPVDKASLPLIADLWFGR